MILKFKRNGNWVFIDNLKSVTRIMEDKVKWSGFVSYEQGEQTFSLCVKEGCYLLNDSGKTIESLHYEENAVE